MEARGIHIKEKQKLPEPEESESRTTGTGTGTGTGSGFVTTSQSASRDDEESESPSKQSTKPEEFNAEESDTDEKSDETKQIPPPISLQNERNESPNQSPHHLESPVVTPIYETPMNFPTNETSDWFSEHEVCVIFPTIFHIFVFSMSLKVCDEKQKS